MIGLDVTIYDPELDPGGVYLPGIVARLATGLAARPVPGGNARRDSEPPDDGPGEMAAELLAKGPHVSLGDQACVFDRFVGT